MNETRDLTDAEGLALLREAIETASTIDAARRAELLGRLDCGGLPDALRAELVALMDDEAAFVEADIARGERQLAAWEDELAALDAKRGRTVTPPAAPDDGELLAEFTRWAESRNRPSGVPPTEQQLRESRAAQVRLDAREAAERREFWRGVAQAAACWAVALAALIVYAISR